MNASERANAALQHYHYDAMDRLVALQSSNQPAVRRFYSGTALRSELRGGVRHSHLRAGTQLLGVREQGDGPFAVRLFGTDAQRSVLQVRDDQNPQSLAYTPHGAGADPTLPGFNGEQPDPATGNYLLGNGYRAYNPTLMRFHSPDSFSPFEGGGLNPYTYCLGDPVNATDPTGHLSWSAWVGIGLASLGLGVAFVALGGLALTVGGAVAATLAAGALPASAITAAMIGDAVGIGLGVASGATGIAAGVTSDHADQTASQALGWVSVGLGLASLAVGGVTAVVESLPPKPFALSLLAGTEGPENLISGGLRTRVPAHNPWGRFAVFVDELPGDEAISRLGITISLSELRYGLVVTESAWVAAESDAEDAPDAGAYARLIRLWKT